MALYQQKGSGILKGLDWDPYACLGIFVPPLPHLAGICWHATPGLARQLATLQACPNPSWGPAQMFHSLVPSRFPRGSSSSQRGPGNRLCRLEKAAAQNAALQAQGKKGVEYNDLMMSFSAIHTSADLITQTIFDLAEHPEMIEPLRKEIVTVLSEHGWRKTSLYKLKPMDSVVKETQRLKPVLSASMRRVATADIKLSNGTMIRKGSMIAVSARRQRDPAVYKNPDQWDGYRFHNMRQMPGLEHVAQLVSTSPEHLGFGHGLHACPGRFFAANEIKILLCHFLLKYDFKLAQGSKPQPRCSDFHINSDPVAKISLHRRQGVDLSVLEA
ncbi:hypothetical protein VTN77DRAFT_7439 [Rasamsonia byssochlamydoides]|uniref:uncharacterized protein n=1 Tax=Rasamsonia byssochlamydoides TaxID=89139 RepID=UPI00374361C9